MIHNETLARPNFFQTHGWAILLYFLAPILLNLPTTYMATDVYSVVSPDIRVQNGYWVHMIASRIENAGPCPLNIYLWNSEFQKWSFYAWHFASRLSLLSIGAVLYQYAVLHKIPLPYFFLMVSGGFALLLVAFIQLEAIFYYHSTTCSEAPLLKVNYVIPLLPFVLMVYGVALLLLRHLEGFKLSIPTHEHSQQSPTS